MGSKRDARRAGRYPASEATTTKNSATGGEHAAGHLLPRGHFAIERIAEVQRFAVLQQLEANQALWILDGERAEPNGIQRLENGGVGADAERQCEDRRGGETGASAQLGEGVGEVFQRQDYCAPEDGARARCPASHRQRPDWQGGTWYTEVSIFSTEEFHDFCNTNAPGNGD